MPSQTPNRKVRCIKTGKSYHSVHTRNQARFQRYYRTETEKGLVMQEICAEKARLPVNREKSRKAAVEQHRKDPDLRRRMREGMKNKWDEEEFCETMLASGQKLNDPAYSHMKKCSAEQRKHTRNGKVVVKYVKGERQKSVGVVHRDATTT